jgi:hypothetical protein
MALNWLRKKVSGKEEVKDALASETISVPYIPALKGDLTFPKLDGKLIDALTADVDNRVNHYTSLYVAKTQEIIDNNREKITSETAFAFRLGHVEALSNSLESLPNEILAQVHKGAENDGESMFTVIFQGYARASNYDGMILSKAIRGILDCFHQCLDLIRAETPSLTHEELMRLEVEFHSALTEWREKCLECYRTRWDIIVATSGVHKDDEAIGDALVAWIKAAAQLAAYDVARLFYRGTLPSFQKNLRHPRDLKIVEALVRDGNTEELQASLPTDIQWDQTNPHHEQIIGEYLMHLWEFSSTMEEQTAKLSQGLSNDFASYLERIGSDDVLTTFVDHEIVEAQYEFVEQLGSFVQQELDRTISRDSANS